MWGADVNLGCSEEGKVGKEGEAMQHHFSSTFCSQTKAVFRSTFSNLNLLTFNSHLGSIKQCEIHISGKYVTLFQRKLGKVKTERMWQGIVC